MSWQKRITQKIKTAAHQRLRDILHLIETCNKRFPLFINFCDISCQRSMFLFKTKREDHSLPSTKCKRCIIKTILNDAIT